MTLPPVNYFPEGIPATMEPYDSQADRESPERPRAEVALFPLPPAAAVSLSGVGKSFGDREVLADIHLTIKRGEFVGVVGRSGCGKSTLLRLLAGLEVPSNGTIRFDDVPQSGLNPQTRIMFQDSRLLPWKTVFENVTLGLPKQAFSRASNILAEVGLADRAKDWPARLSGGQRQRVALARALVHHPQLLLLDEPLGALDALTRIEMQQLIERLWHEHGFTAVLVTHDVQEAVAMADRVLLIESGQLALDAPVALSRPRERGDAAFAHLEARVLHRVLQKPGFESAQAPGDQSLFSTVAQVRWAI
jgi:sulfonate transport system ATP-binding protein